MTRADADTTFRVLTTRDELQAIGDRWQQLAAARANPLLSHAWQSCAALTLYPDKALRIVVAERDGRLIGAAPLAVASRAGGTMLELLGSSVLHEPADFIFDDAATLRALCAYVARMGLPVSLARVPQATREMLFEHTRGSGTTIATQSSGCPWLAIDASWPDYLKTLSSRRLSDFRAARRKLEREGPVKIHVDDSPAQLSEVFRIEAAGWKGRAGSSLADRPAMRDFFTAAAQSFAAGQALRIFRLHVGEECIAVQLCLQYGQRLWILKIGYDDRWSKLSPGSQLMWEVVRHAFEQRLSSVEFLGTAESWLQVWTRQEREYVNARFYPRNVRGLISFATDSCVRVAAAVQRRLRPG